MYSCYQPASLYAVAMQTSVPSPGTVNICTTGTGPLSNVLPTQSTVHTSSCVQPAQPVMVSGKCPATRASRTRGPRLRRAALSYTAGIDTTSNSTGPNSTWTKSLHRLTVACRATDYFQERGLGFASIAGRKRGYREDIYVRNTIASANCGDLLVC